MSQRATLRMGRVRRWIRGWWPDRNPLRRRCDRVEAAVAAGLIATMAVGGPVVAVLGAQGAYRASLRIQQSEQASWHQVPAVLLADADGPTYSFAGTRLLPQVQARWTAPDGATRTGMIAVTGFAAAGSTVKVWVNGSGRPTRAPMLHKQVTGQAVLGAMVGISALAFALACAWALARRTLRRRQLAAWDDDWGITAARWTSRR